MTREDLLSLCGSTRWVELMGDHAPFVDHSALHAAADLVFEVLDEADWLEAFAHHPRIGDVDALRERFAGSGAFSEREQSGIGGAGEDVIQALADGNDEYERRFGFVFLIRAAGRSAEEMLEAQRERLAHDRSTELAIAAHQQREITHGRIDALVLD